MADKIPVIRPDDELANADWTKRSWDFPDWTPEQVASLFVGKSVAEVSQLPVMVWNPKQAQPVLAALAKLNAE